MGFILNNKVSQAGDGNGGFLNLNVSSGPTYPSFYDSTLIQGFSFETVNNVVTGSSDSLNLISGSLSTVEHKVGLKSLYKGVPATSLAAITEPLPASEFYATISCWVYVTGPHSGYLFAGQSNVFQTTFQSDSIQTSIRVIIGDADNFLCGPLANFAWTHVVVTANADTGLAKVYLNGNLAGSSNNFSDMYGSDCSAFLFYQMNTLQSFMDEYYYWERELTATEVGQLYALGNAGKSYPWAS